MTAQTSLLRRQRKGGLWLGVSFINIARSCFKGKKGQKSNNNKRRSLFILAYNSGGFSSWLISSGTLGFIMVTAAKPFTSWMK